MANTYTSLNVHYVFSTKGRAPMINENIRERLWAFMAGIAKENRIEPRCIGGVADHVHLLLSLPTTLSTAACIKLIKGGSSAWINNTFPAIHDFAWQEGYGAFNVSVSHLNETMAYIKNQEEHHRRRTFQEEYLAFLKKNRISYDEKYLWI